MTQAEYDSINGRLFAISTTIGALIGALPQVSAAQAAVALKVELITLQEEDKKAATSPVEIHSRDALTNAFLELLSIVAKKD